MRVKVCGCDWQSPEMTNISTLFTHSHTHTHTNPSYLHTEDFDLLWKFLFRTKFLLECLDLFAYVRFFKG